MTKPGATRRLRIIGGTHRSRVITFPDRKGIRPTPDRVRETLFNWLQTRIIGARCLELYAGSAILSMEAVSRGAAHVTLVEQDAPTCQTIRDNLKLLGMGHDHATLAQHDVDSWLARKGEPFDVVFMDPPFDNAPLDSLLSQLAGAGRVATDGVIYVESNHALDPETLPPGYEVLRHKKAGQVHATLLEMAS